MRLVRSLLVLAALIPCLVVVVAFGFAIGRGRECARNRDRFQLEAVEQAFLAYRDAFGRLPDWGEGRPFHLTEDMHAVLADGHNPMSRVFLERPFPLVDFWGNPIWIALARDGEDSVTVGGRRLPQPVAAWSAGPDGVNQEGLGDDLTPGW